MSADRTMGDVLQRMRGILGHLKPRDRAIVAEGADVLERAARILVTAMERTKAAEAAALQPPDQGASA